MSPTNAPSMQAMSNMGRLFEESDSDSVAMLILEGDEPLGQDAHDYYDGLIEKLRADAKHVQHIQDFWGIRSPNPGRKATTARPRTCS